MKYFYQGMWNCLQISDIHYQSKVFVHSEKNLFLILKVLILMKQVKHHNFLNFISQQNTQNMWTYTWKKIRDHYFEKNKDIQVENF